MNQLNEVSLLKNGYVQAVKAKGENYFYVRFSFRNEKKMPQAKNLLGLGRKNNALEQLQSWIEDENTIPEIMEGYTKEQFIKWVQYVENK